MALGVDRNGLSLSVSTAIAPNSGPALATTFNVSIGTRGDVSHSVGQTVATGGASRTVSAGGSTSTATRYSSGTAVARASGRTSFGGVVRSQTRSVQQPPAGVDAPSHLAAIARATQPAHADGLSTERVPVESPRPRARQSPAHTRVVGGALFLVAEPPS